MSLAAIILLLNEEKGLDGATNEDRCKIVSDMRSDVSKRCMRTQAHQVWSGSIRTPPALALPVDLEF